VETAVGKLITMNDREITKTIQTRGCKAVKTIEMTTMGNGIDPTEIEIMITPTTGMITIITTIEIAIMMNSITITIGTTSTTRTEIV